MEMSLANAEPAPLTELDLAGLAALPEYASREDIERFADRLLAGEKEHGILDLGLLHHHGDHLYGRSGVIRKHTYLVGLPHKQGSFNVCIGDITVWTEGQGRRRLTGTHFLTSGPGAMRVGLAHQDTTWLTVHANLTGSTDVETIENAVAEGAHRLMTRRAAPQLRVA